MPSSAAATRPSAGRPTAAHHEPPADAAAANARVSEVEWAPSTATTDPRRNPPDGNSGSRAASTGRRCSPAMETGAANAAKSLSGKSLSGKSLDWHP